MARKIALVTGGSRGIGKAICLGLAQDGYDIWLNYRSDKESASAAKTEIAAFGVSCSLLEFDVSDNKSVENVLSPMLAEATPDALINNAGITSDSLLGLMSEKAWSSVINTDLNSFYNVTHLVIRSMLRARAGRVITVTSVSGQAGNAGQVNYSAAKAGLIGATKALAKEVAKRGILVNAVAPGFIATEMSAGLDMQKYIPHIPLGRAGSPEDVAGAVRFLCSDWANYITGQVIAVNGGLYA